MALLSGAATRTAGARVPGKKTLSSVLDNLLGNALGFRADRVSATAGAIRLARKGRLATAPLKGKGAKGADAKAATDVNVAANAAAKVAAKVATVAWTTCDNAG